MSQSVRGSVTSQGARDSSYGGSAGVINEIFDGFVGVNNANVQLGQVDDSRQSYPACSNTGHRSAFSPGSKPLQYLLQVDVDQKVPAWYYILAWVRWFLETLVPLPSPRHEPYLLLTVYA